MVKYICRYPFSLLVIVAILFLSLFNPPETRLDDVTFIDKIAHVCMYGGLELIIWVEYLRRHADLNKVKFILLGIAAPIALGGIMELAQMLLTVNRSGEWADFIADTLGVLAGAAAGLFILRPLIWKKRYYYSLSQVL